MSAAGSVREFQLSAAGRLNLPGSFRGTRSAPPMTVGGWLAEWQVLNEASAKVEAKRTVCGVPVLHALGTTPRAK